MASDNFCLRWNDFESNISASFVEIRESEEFFDVTLTCDYAEEQINAHKVVLAACSPFFRRLLARNPHNHPLIYLKGIDYDNLRAVLNFMYHGEVNVSQDDLPGFLRTAEELSVKGLTDGGDDSKMSQAGGNVGTSPADTVRQFVNSSNSSSSNQTQLNNNLINNLLAQSQLQKNNSSRYSGANVKSNRLSGANVMDSNTVVNNLSRRPASTGGVNVSLSSSQLLSSVANSLAVNSSTVASNASVNNNASGNNGNSNSNNVNSHHPNLVAANLLLNQVLAGSNNQNTGQPSLKRMRQHQQQQVQSLIASHASQGTNQSKALNALLNQSANVGLSSSGSNSRNQMNTNRNSPTPCTGGNILVINNNSRSNMSLQSVLPQHDGNKSNRQLEGDTVGNTSLQTDEEIMIDPSDASATLIVNEEDENDDAASGSGSTSGGGIRAEDLVETADMNDGDEGNDNGNGSGGNSAAAISNIVDPSEYLHESMVTSNDDIVTDDCGSPATINSAALSSEQQQIINNNSIINALANAGVTGIENVKDTLPASSIALALAKSGNTSESDHNVVNPDVTAQLLQSVVAQQQQAASSAGGQGSAPPLPPLAMFGTPQHPSSVDNFWFRHNGYIWCNTCGFNSASKTDVTRHIEARHFSPGYVCPHCGLETKTKMSLNKHMKRKHADLAPGLSSSVDGKGQVNFKSEKAMTDYS